jgi:aspartate-semialdehyde dehydrogenase
MGYRVAVIGATGNVGREMLQTLSEREFPADDVIALASERSAGSEVSFGEDKVLKVYDLAKFDFKGVDIALSSPGAKVSAMHSPRAAAAGAVVIDNTSYFRMEPDIPLVVPEVNPQAIDGYEKRGIIANPNCSTIQMVVALKPAAPRSCQDQAGGGGDLSIGFWRRQGWDGRTVRADPRHLYERAGGEEQIHQADRLQRHPPYR